MREGESERGREIEFVDIYVWYLDLSTQEIKE